ncbi:MAG: hypothetical protein WD716_11080 [Fimbriimonadaceae bacterium]
MGRIIGGVVVGFICAAVASFILGMAILFMLGTSNIVMPETFEPTTIYMVVGSPSESSCTSSAARSRG